MRKFVVISDAHLGQTGRDQRGQFSLLSQIPENMPEQRQRAEEKTEALAKMIETFAQADGDAAEPVTLIGNGDMLDLSLAYLKDGLDDLVALLKRLKVKKFIWIIGNHDHHIWTLHSEQNRLHNRLIQGREPHPGSMYTATSDSGNTLSLLQSYLAQHVGGGFEVDIAYPSLRLNLVDNNDSLPPAAREVLCYFTHGHLFGGLYTTLSRILAARLPGFRKEDAAATVNMPLIELIYWLIGEMGEGFGADGLIETIYTDLQRGNDSEARAIVDAAVDALLPEGIITGIPDSWERSSIKKLGHYLLKQVVKEAHPNRSRSRHRDVASTEQQFERWAIDTANLPVNRRVIAAYGHTHVADCHPIHSTLVTAYNLGSWLVEAGHEEPDTMALFIDEGPNKLTVKWDRI